MVSRARSTLAAVGVASVVALMAGCDLTSSTMGTTSLLAPFNESFVQTVPAGTVFTQPVVVTSNPLVPVTVLTTPTITGPPTTLGGTTTVTPALSGPGITGVPFG